MAGRNSILQILFTGLALGLTGCAGPTSPFGAILSWENKEKNISKPANQYSATPLPVIDFEPSRHVYHNKTSFQLTIVDLVKRPQLEHVFMTYDGKDITDTFRRNVQVKSSATQLVLSYEGLRLKLRGKNEIQVTYQRDEDQVFQQAFLPPHCPVLQMADINNTGRFRPPDRFLQWMNESGEKYNLNPALLAGLIAQESSFNTRAVSSAKALGLTQITSLAEKQISDKISDWPKYQSLRSFSVKRVKREIYSGHINAKNEWRLHPQKSIEGGAAYLDYLKRYWSSEKNRAYIASLKGEFNKNYTDVVLASYNSGAARVKYAIKTKKDQWLQYRHLFEASKYVRRVNSYCFHFSTASSKPILNRGPAGGSDG